MRHDWATTPRSYLSLPGESSNRIFRGLSRLLLLLESFLRVITDWFFRSLFLAFGRVHVALLLHAPRRALFHVLLDLLDRSLFKHVPHHIKVAQVLSQLRLANVNQLLLRDAVSAHVSLNRSRVKVFILLDDRDNIQLPSSAPGMLDAFRSIDSFFMHL